MSDTSVSVTNGCCSPNEIHVHDGDKVTWSTTDNQSYTITPPAGVFASDDAMTLPANGSVTSPLVTGAVNSNGKVYSVSPGCAGIEAVGIPPDIVIDGNPVPGAARVSATAVAAKKSGSKKKSAKKAAKKVAKNAPVKAVKKTAPKNAAPKKAAVKKAAVKKAAVKKAAVKKGVVKKAAVKKAVKKAPAKKKR